MTPRDAAERATTEASDHPTDVLVSPEWVEARLDQFEADDPAYRLVEVDVNSDFYDDGHAPGAVGFEWRTDLRSATSRDIVSPAELERVLGEAGIGPDTTVVAYGDNANWFATHFYWMLRYYGHPDVRVMDGGREYWLEHDYPTVREVPDFDPVDYAVQDRVESVRAYRDEVREAIGTETAFVDVRSTPEFVGTLTSPPGDRESAQRGGHIPGATNVFWADNVGPDRRFRSAEALRELYTDHGVEPDQRVVTYCRIGERSAVTWFVLQELLGYEDVANYDGSWVEWGNMIRAPIETGP
ncbi:sulfurtransferase [Salinirubellus salinus]|uniref:Sulfurtransferase n=1 Tax=Salinirubellus salinus TaxID=1364945 RepID=A0A9E7R1V3_9EURY|nr:sulfurtransferase [Salinirubellus salinus]UWM53977.1 sulfurtransferase [Salinirubellus salinus]